MSSVKQAACFFLRDRIPSSMDTFSSIGAGKNENRKKARGRKAWQASCNLQGNVLIHDALKRERLK